jgi:hypothetical protein
LQGLKGYETAWELQAISAPRNSFHFTISYCKYGEPSPYEIKSVNLELVDTPARRNPWRPATLTIGKFLTICRQVENGWAVKRACEVEGISYRNSRLQERLQEAETVRFNLRHEQALESIMAAGERNWMAHAWWLERNLPQL